MYSVNNLRVGFSQSIRHEDGRMELYDYALEGGLWSIIETHAHEQSPEPVDGKTTRDITITNHRGEILEQNSKNSVFNFSGLHFTVEFDKFTLPSGKESRCVLCL